MRLHYIREDLIIQMLVNLFLIFFVFCYLSVDAQTSNKKQDSA
jgi:hypothetical protein